MKSYYKITSNRNNSLTMIKHRYIWYNNKQTANEWFLGAAGEQIHLNIFNRVNFQKLQPYNFRRKKKEV